MLNHYQRNVDETREIYDVTGEELITVENAPIRYEDDFLGKSIDTTNDWSVAAVNSGAATIVVASGGVARLTTGAAADDDIEMASPIIFDPTKGLILEARVRTADAAHTGCFVGFTDDDDDSADTIAMTFATATLTTTATDAAGIFWDGAATANLIRAASVKNNTDGTTFASSLTQADNTWHTFRVEIDKNQTTRFYVDGDLIGTQLLAVTSTVLLCAYVGAITHGESAANTVDVDYIRVYQLER